MQEGSCSDGRLVRWSESVHGERPRCGSEVGSVSQGKDVVQESDEVLESSEHRRPEVQSNPEVQSGPEEANRPPTP